MPKTAIILHAEPGTHDAMGRAAHALLYTNRMLKKSVLDFFSHGLAEVNSSKPYKLLNFFVSQFGNPSVDCIAGCVFPHPAKDLNEAESR